MGEIVMDIKAMTSAIDEKYEQVKAAIDGDDLLKIRELSLELHAMVHPAEISGKSEKTIADFVLDYMMQGNQNELVPRETWETDLHYAGSATVPICWQFWHTYRIEDLVSNILMNNGQQIFNDEWQKRIGSSITDTGNALEPDEVIAWGKDINVVELRDYMIAVGKNTREILSGLTLEQIKSMVPEEWVMRILEEGGVTTDFRSVWLLVFWGRLTVGGMILTPMTSHHMMHLPTSVDKILGK
jgi:NADH:ubiquinone oxidoreductase subunit